MTKYLSDEDFDIANELLNKSKFYIDAVKNILENKVLYYDLEDISSAINEAKIEMRRCMELR